MIKKLNNKGYMLVEIILAFVIAMGVAYFMFELVIKLKNKNDDLIVKTLVATDQAIIYNTIMRDLTSGNSFVCSKINIENNKFKYDNKYVSEISEYATVSSVTCNKNGNDVSIKIPIKVNQLKDNFDINIKYTLDEVTSPTPTPTPSSTPTCPAGYRRGPYIYGGVYDDSCYRSVSETEGCGANETLQGCESFGDNQCWCTLNR